MRFTRMTAVAGVVAACSAAVAARAIVERDGVDYRPDVVLQIGVANLDASIGFYTKTLGFTVTERRDDLKFAHVQSNLPGLEIGLNEVPAPKGSGSTVVNIGVRHVGRARAALEARGVTFRGPTQVIPGKVALAGFADPDGNVLRLAGPPETATASR
jgi:catechol 2,3-dioxygenase-like lactoylglutathione lyase family enzyme